MTWEVSPVSVPFSELDRGITYLKNIMVHCDGNVIFNSYSGILLWDSTLRIVFNRTDGQAILNTVTASSISLSGNEFAYLDLNETNNTVITMAKAAISTGTASNFITYNRVVMGIRNSASGRYFKVYLEATENYFPLLIFKTDKLTANDEIITPGLS